MITLSQVAGAVRTAREVTKKFKSDNKIPARESAVNGPRDALKRPAAEAMNAANYFDALGKIKWNDVSTLESYAKLVMETGAGNCQDLSIVVFNELRKNGSGPIEIVSGSAMEKTMFSHVFVLAGRNDSKSLDQVSQVAGLGSGVFVGDPWANIVCNAAEYPGQWTNKMKKWAAAGKRILEEGCPLKLVLPTEGASLKFVAAGTLNVLTRFEG